MPLKPTKPPLVRGGGADIVRHTPGLAKGKPGAVTHQKKTKTPLLDRLRVAEANFASIKDSDPNAKFALSRLRAQQQAVDGNDSLYFICVSFQSRQQKDVFLKAVHLFKEDEEQYFSGLELARNLGVKLSDDTRAFTPMTVNDRWSKYAMPDQGPGRVQAPKPPAGKKR